MSLEDILKVLVDSRQQGGVSSSTGNQDPMANLVGSLLGGGQAGNATGEAVGALVGSLLGGTQPQGSGNQQPAGGLGNMMGMLEAVMGGGSSMGANDPIMGLLQPFVTPLAKKAKISPETAMVVVSFVAHKLLAHHPASGRDSNSFNFEDMAQQIAAGKIDQNLLQSSGMVKELAAKTGLNEDTATKSLQFAFTLVGKSAVGLMNKSASKTTAPVKTVGKSAPTSGKAGLTSGSRSGRTIKR